MMNGGMSSYLDNPTFYCNHYVWIWTAMAFLFTSLAYMWLGQRLEKKSCYPHIPPPRSTWGLFETLERLYSVHFHDYCLHEARNEGKIVEVNVWPLIRVPVFSIHDPKVARKILENPNSLKPRGLYDFFDGVMGGTSFISEEGERYKHPRKSVSIGISHSNMDSMFTKMHSVMDEWIAANLGKNEGDVVNVDITMEMQKATIQSIGKIAFGYDFSQGETERTLSNLVKGFEEFGVACEMNPIRKSPLGIFLWAAKREALRCVQDTRLLLQNVLLSHDSKSAEEQKRALALNELTTPGRYETIGGAEALISDMKLLFVAGFDTTGHTISFALVELAKNIAVQTQLREELRKVSQDPTDKQRHVDNTLLKRVVKETMRLWPVVAGGGARIIPEDMVVTSNDGSGEERSMKIPKGSISMTMTFSIMRDKDTFDRPDEWLPDRWKNPTQDMKTAFIPFMVGRRSCPGQLLAMAESEVFLARLLMDYEWSLVKETQPEYIITLKIKGTILQAKKIA